MSRQCTLSHFLEQQNVDPSELPTSSSSNLTETSEKRRKVEHCIYKYKDTFINYGSKCIQENGINLPQPSEFFVRKLK